MKITIVLPVVLSVFAWADESADRKAIDSAIAALNQQPFPERLFPDEVDGVADLAGLWNVKRPSIRRIKPPDQPTSPSPGALTVTISKEPWGEATIGWPNQFPTVQFEMLNPRIAGKAIRFITPDVAIADGAWTYTEGSETQIKSLFFVLKKVGGDWKIASMRVLEGVSR